MSHVQDITTIKHLVLQTYHKRSLSFWEYIYIFFGHRIPKLWE
jgi:hypothetical protein